MKKAAISLAMIIITVLLVIPAGCNRTNARVNVEIVRTERADVFNTIGFIGQLGYVDERYILSRTTGTIDEICVEEGQRVAKEEALVRFGGNGQEEAVSALVAEMEKIPLNLKQDAEWANAVLTNSVQRSDADCTIRQILVKDQGTVVTGTPMLRVSGTAQEIRCFASQADAEKVMPGMWAWIAAKGQKLGTAFVQSVEKQTDGTTGQIIYVIKLSPEQNTELHEGSSIDVDVYVSGSHDVISLPVEVITDRETVWWVSDGGICTEIPARIVICDENRAWVDLPEGIHVAVGEFMEGQRVAEVSQ
ncbi:MAG: efflux RND transporter periplasmic adaptor subunit [Clostridiales bacterium]|nr:efflux RND transporter periplasmic adaptor subunit [Clostridiales bacterium]